MTFKDILKSLMMSDFYFNLPVWERRQLVSRLWVIHGAKLSSAPVPRFCKQSPAEYQYHSAHA
jgi:hypothetical protein